MRQDSNKIWVVDDKAELSFPDYANDRTATIEDVSFWYAHRNAVIVDAMNRNNFEGDYADIGGGNGFQLLHVAKMMKPPKSILIEPGYQGCLNAMHKGADHVYNMTYEQFDFSSFNVGAVGLYDVLEHIDDHVSFLNGVKAKLGPGKLIFMTVPAFNLLWSKNDENAGHYRRYTKSSVRKLAKDCDLKLIEFSYFFSYLFPSVLLLRSIPSRLGWIKKIESHNSVDQHRTKEGKRVIISKVGEIERSMIKNNLVPFGSSCLAIFRT